MQRIHCLMPWLITALVIPNVSFGNENTSVLEGPYLGQKQPGSTPLVFAPGVISTEKWGDAGRFSLDMNQFYVSRWSHDSESEAPMPVTYIKKNNKWIEVSETQRRRTPFFSPDGTTQHFGKRFKERTRDGWSELKSLGPDFEDIRIMSLSTSEMGTYAFDEIGTNGNGILRYSRLIDGKREAPQAFGPVINTGTWNAHPFIAPDESYVMWDGDRDSGYGSSDIWISFKLQDGSWGEAINLGEKINTEAEEGGPQVTPDGKFLFFNRMVPSAANNDEPQSDLFWVDAQIIEELKKQHYLNHPPEASAWEQELPFRETPYLQHAFIDPTPYSNDKDITVGTIAIDTGEQARILELAHEITKGEHGKFDSLLIAHKGQLVFESYYARGRVDLPHPQASATKAYTSLAIGRAIQLGYLSMEDLHKPLISFLKELDYSKLVSGAETITLHKALSMRSGVRLSREKRDQLEQNPSELAGQKEVQAYLEHSDPITPESQTFKYQFDPKFVMQVIEAVVPGSAEEFIKRELLDKLGITSYYWRTDINGLPMSGHSSGMTSRDMLKWGLLAMNKGKWNGEQLIPQVYIEKATDRLFLTGDEDFYFGGENTVNQGYGYYWWSGDFKYEGKSYFARSAQGGWGQIIVLIEELDLIVVTTGHDNDASYLQVVAERIMPAFIK